MKFWALWGFDVLVASVFVWFFVIGVGDGSVSSFNIGLWLGILGTLVSVLGGALLLRHLERGVLALGLLLVLATPAILGLFFFLVVLV